MSRTIPGKLAKLHLITPGGIGNIVGSFWREGVSIMAVIRFAAHYYPDCCALVCDGKRFSYKEMYDNATRLAKILYADFGLKMEMSVGLMCRNHVMMALLLPALSRLGVAVKMINADMASSRVSDLVTRKKINLLICDTELKEARVPDGLPCKTLKTEDGLIIKM